MVIKTKKTKKSKGQRGKTTHGHGARKKWKGSGHRGGIGMAGTGKKADQKKTLITKLYGNKYFGKKGITSLHSYKDKTKKINLREIQTNLDQLTEKFGEKGKLILKNHKILGDGEFKEKIEITARAFTRSAKEKIEKAGGKAILTVKPKEKRIEAKSGKKEEIKRDEKKEGKAIKDDKNVDEAK